MCARQIYHFLLKILYFITSFLVVPLSRNLMLLRSTTPSQLFLWVLNSEAETHSHAPNSLLIYKILGFSSPFHLPFFKVMAPAYPWLLLVEDYSLYYFPPENKKLNKVPSIPKIIFYQFSHSLFIFMNDIFSRTLHTHKSLTASHFPFLSWIFAISI